MTEAQMTAKEAQSLATDPLVPIWVSASAGSGKTTILTNRMLRLMLPSRDRTATDPARILCITYTKAAATEVGARVLKIVRQWAISDRAALVESLTGLLGQAPDDTQIQAAQALFARILDAPGGMKIMTIHAFCQSVLTRFPLEAGLPAGFHIMEEADAQLFMRDARHSLIQAVTALPEGDALKASYTRLSQATTIEALESLIQAAMAERAQLRRLVAQAGDVERLIAEVYVFLGIAKGAQVDDVVRDFWQDYDVRYLEKLAQFLNGNSKKEQGMRSALLGIVAAPLSQRMALTDAAFEIVLKSSRDEIKSPNLGSLKKNPEVQALFDRIGADFLALDGRMRAALNAQTTADMLRFALAILDVYDARKRARNMLDFNDLIERTAALLQDSAAAWVMYKLDGGIDHILVDEAQDTSPDQWRIILALISEFTQPIAAGETRLRTSFVVGDEKQSIYSFQGADARVFENVRQQLKAAWSYTNRPMETVPLRISYRSAPAVLQFVDTAFDTDEMRVGVVQTGARVQHTAHKLGMAGAVELWPLIKPHKKKDRPSWSLPLNTTFAPSTISVLADKIAAHIRNWLDTRAMLPGHNRPIEPRDIMILLRKRQPFASALLRALRLQNIPVTGLDRMVVSDQLAVEDVLAVIAFVLQPQDDLNLAALLKSPFIGLDDDALLPLCHGRTGPLIDRLADHACWQWLQDVLVWAKTGTISYFLHALLQRPCPANRHSGLQALLTRLGSDARDPIEEILAKADRFDAYEAQGLQGFYQAMRDDKSELKRQSETQHNKVRVLTIHGSKGLEAPIVIMPDTVRSVAGNAKSVPLLWPARSGLPVPLWAPHKRAQSDDMRSALDARKRDDDMEYRRLLYVALTRAANHLILCATQKGTGNLRPDSWYFACAAAFTRLQDVQTQPFDVPDSVVCEAPEIRRIDNPQTVALHDDAITALSLFPQDVPLPEALYAQAPAFKQPGKPLMPSRPLMPEVAALSPLVGQNEARFKRGRIIHTLFQFLPTLDPAARQTAAMQWLSRPAHDLNVGQQADILSCVMAVLDAPEFAPLFGAHSRAEVPISGLLPGNEVAAPFAVSGQIDRLCVLPHEVIVVDFKTNRPAPLDIANVPASYIVQLRLYRDLLARIYPDRPIRTCLLWTDGPRIMDLSAQL